MQCRPLTAGKHQVWSDHSVGFGPTMLALTLVLVVGLLVSIAWAPETKGTVLV